MKSGIDSMTENKRYFDGSLAKWYYSRDYSGMRVISNGVDEFVLNSKKQFRDINNEELKGTNQLLDELNKLEDRIISLKKENEQLKIHMKSAKAHLEGGHTKKAIERLKIIDIR
jgi:cell shape-determining protein MreC